MKMEAFLSFLWINLKAYLVKRYGATDETKVCANLFWVFSGEQSTYGTFPYKNESDTLA